MLPQLKCIWKGPTGHVSLQSLTNLELYSLHKLTFIFTPSLAQSLPKLESLRISECGELKHIIREEDAEREIIPICENEKILLGDHLQSLCFSNLCEIEIRECNKLKSLFPVAMASGLPKLQTLKVCEASQLVGVFRQDDPASPVNVEKEMVLPNLKKLSLKQLSSIVCFNFECCDFLFPCLEKLKVYGCPKLSTKFAITLDGSMSAQSEVSEVAEDSSINRVWTRNNGWKEVKENVCLLSNNSFLPKPGKQVLDAAHSSNGLTPTNEIIQFQSQNNHQVHAPSQSTETNSSLAVNFPVEDSGMWKKDGRDTEQALSVKPLQVLQPIVDSHHAVASIPSEDYKTGKMTQLLQTEEPAAGSGLN
ncbi:hypothetical protein NC651_004264 [Populus alba x Populus x berolinensis]|nr:hypothetical protein NC651_004264 [Populus alba x Populus x berolinensis]